MPRDIPRTCTNCRDYFGVVVNKPPLKSRVLPINGFCVMCGCQPREWKVILGGSRSDRVSELRMRKGLRIRL